MQDSVRHGVKRMVRDAIVFMCSVTGITFLYRRRMHSLGASLRVVVFHDVPDAEWFESMIRTLTESYTVITPEAFFTHTYERNGVQVLVTFDDGYASWIQVALPILERYGVQALFFVNSDLVKCAGDTPMVETYMRESLLVTPKPALTEEGVRMLKERGHTIGGHTRTHPNLATLTPLRVYAEVHDDKNALEEILGVTLTEFAYPFGTEAHITEQVEHVVREVGYHRAYTTLSRFVDTKETFSIPRMCIESTLTPRGLKRWVCGSYDLFAMIKSSVKKM